MGNIELNVSDTMRYSRHDHMNDLQLLLMYLDMGKYKEARKCILDKTAEMQQLAMLQKLCMPLTEEWLTTLDWRYPVFKSHLHCDIASKIEVQQIDEVLVDYLERLVQDVIPKIDQYAECPVEITVRTDAAGWSIQMTFSEIHAKQMNISENSSLLTVEVCAEEGQWTFIISGQLGGL
ncbi:MULTISPECIES: Spo0B domain-containing protein [Sporosarcina]|uniref:Spo0B domain-containing protein n=1 Tax=Sporosarcina TaxID=1569 RepID=UPI001C8D50E7|nr:Spo0B domain-containing protein [Sporosarcina aquimarina]MBY0222551.1 Spo0B domain-containing protein [Sporosarcina aquimarina]